MFRHPARMPILAFVLLPLVGCGSEATGPETSAASILTAFPVDSAMVKWMSPYGNIPQRGLHPGFDLGSPNGGWFFAAGAGRVERVDLDTGHGLPGTNYEIIIEVGELTIDYHFEIDGNATEQERRASVLVEEGESVDAGQPIAYLLSRGDGAHVHFGVMYGGDLVCPLEHFSGDVGARLEALYDSGIERRGSGREDLCE